MNDYRYYTPAELAKQLLRLIPNGAAITSIADICCGTWNLLDAAHSLFPTASIVGVDIDPASRNRRIEDSAFHSMDGRDFAAQMERDGISFDLLLSNPPFGALALEQKKYNGEENVFANSRRYESELFYANTKLVKEAGYLLIILPITYAQGTRYREHRMWIAANYDVLNIVTLGPNTFSNKALNTIALLLRKTTGPQNCTTQIMISREIDQEWMLVEGSTLTHDEIISGNWFSSYATFKSSVAVYRGSISSHYFTDDGMPVLHCSNRVTNGNWIPSVRHCKGIKSSDKKYVEPGDIIINRIGKCAARWSVYTGKKCLISDCLIVIKHPDETIRKKISQFSKDGVLQVPKLGVATPYISAKDIMSLLNE